MISLGEMYKVIFLEGDEGFMVYLIGFWKYFEWILSSKTYN